MERSKLDVKITSIEKQNNEVLVTFALENNADDLNVVEVTRCTFLDFTEVQSLSKVKDNIEDLKVKGQSFLSFSLAFALTNAFDGSHKGAITLDLFDSVVAHHISYSFDIDGQDNYELKDIYESDHNDPIFNNGDAGKAIMDLVSQLKDTLGANVIVKEVNGSDLEDFLPTKKEDKLLN